MQYTTHDHQTINSHPASAPGHPPARQRVRPWLPAHRGPPALHRRNALNGAWGRGPGGVSRGGHADVRESRGLPGTDPEARECQGAGGDRGGHGKVRGRAADVHRDIDR